MQRKLGRFVRHALDVARYVAGRYRMDAQPRLPRKSCFPFPSSPAPSPAGRLTSWPTILPAAPAGRSKAGRTASRRIFPAPTSRPRTGSFISSRLPRRSSPNGSAMRSDARLLVIKVGFFDDQSIVRRTARCCGAVCRCTGDDELHCRHRAMKTTRPVRAASRAGSAEIAFASVCRAGQTLCRIGSCMPAATRPRLSVSVESPRRPMSGSISKPAPRPFNWPLRP